MKSTHVTSLALIVAALHLPATAHAAPRATPPQLAQLGIQKRLHPYVTQMYDTWCKNIAEDKGHLSSSESTERKIRELEGGQRWYQSNKHQVVQHPDYGKTLPEFNQLMYELVKLKARRAVEFAQQGVSEKNPNFFNGSSGLDQQLREAEQLLSQTQADAGAASPEAQAASDAISKARTECETLAARFRSLEASSFRLPAEAYSGRDKGQLRQMVLARWKALYPQDQVVGVRFVDRTWERKRSSEYIHGTWYHHDVSALRVYVVIKKTAELGEVYPAYINKDNASGKLEVGAETKGSSYSHSGILLKNARF